MDGVHAVVKMRNLESWEPNIELANEDGSDEQNVALVGHDVKDWAFQFYSLHCLKLIYTL